ncbi:hormogonium polysaccharide biosynthesis protein HpsA [Nostoc sp. XA010]|uniref:hormogonium polysaccharide biosynthesis protein HpsA n=1 Tax=Nostoc sp. XA010 TaxID=2780407 RepID=UPI001E487AAE|nr:hormogonium polysaccharide biosynthesis protein HpsA [Nostoc sp. XA010]MCC5659718.1 hormogonium polysaccharide biosynthesis protein HpsA [Nostoc sp. XA010]
MSVRRKLFKAVIFNLKKLSSQILSTIKKQIIWLLRTIFTTNRRRGTGNAGFVLPTVAMVSVVVVLLTTAILFRSFERSKNASNVRVNEAALNAATPAIDRARAKLNKLFKDGSLPRATPTDDALYSTLDGKINEYTFGDETQLRLALNNLEKAKRTEDIEKNKELKTAWLYPVDTDNNGKFDSYTLYGIYFRNPPINAGVYKYGRNPLEARTPPMTASNVSGDCGDTLGTSATLVGNTGWFKVGNKLKKAFFVYTATVPITSPPASNTNYEAYKGNKSFSGLEYQQERIQIPVVNNAVLYEDDMGLSPGPAFRLNGRIFTNSNFLTGSPTNSVQLYQVSSRASCFYDADNAKIVIGGNLGAGGFTDTSDLGNVTKVHLFRKGEATDPVEVDFAKSTTPAANEANLIAYNSLAYTQRINRLVNAQIATTNPDPAEVTSGIQQQKDKLGLASLSTAEELTLRKQQLQLYFQKRTRRVPYREVPSGSTESVALGAYVTTTPLQGSGDTLRPVDVWMYPTNPTDGKTGTGYSNLTLSISGNQLIPGATEPTTLQKTYDGKEQSLGDRVVIGNNLPQIWWDSNQNRFVGPDFQDTQNISGVNWNLPATPSITRTRRSRVEILADLGSTDRDKDWEVAAAQVPANIQDPVGGLRVVTGAGIYLPNTFTPASTDFSSAAREIWSDLMPVPQSPAPLKKTIKPYWMYDYSSVDVTNYSSIEYKWPEITDPTKTPYLRMRATAVYHYKAASYNKQNPQPIACVSSFYLPTNSTTAKNLSTLPAWASDASSSATGGLSNNGIVYGPPTRTETNYQALLTYQSQLKYPKGDIKGDPKRPLTPPTTNPDYLAGRSIDDELLAKALAKTAANRTLSEQSTIHAAICALQILDGSISPVISTPPIPHGAIRETAFLDARQVKANQTTDTSTDYDLEKKDRQPLEIRATVLEINSLRTRTIGGETPAQEYLLPNSGIIYATRDDALPDLSSTKTDTEAKKLESPVDYKVDPTRRPNAIMLVKDVSNAIMPVLNRQIKIGRGTSNNYRDVEKGLILATNLPAYVNGDFNPHTQEEFTTALADNWSNFYTRTKAERNPNFACRPSDTRLPNCTTGDEWRPASVLADSVTLLSNNFRLGFREEGDYGWSNSYNAPFPIPSGFSQYNSFVPLAQWRNTTTGIPKDLVPDVDGNSTTTGFQGSSYLNNFVTPIVLQIPPGTYLTEVCSATNVADCSDPTKATTAWTIQTACGGGGGNTFYNGQIVGKNGNPDNSRLKTGYIFDDPETDYSGGCFPATAPRRIAFVRDATGRLVTPLRVLGVDTTNPGDVRQFPLGSTTSTTGTTLLPPPNNVFMPWLKPVIDGGVVRSFEPVLQINQPFATPQSPNNNDLITAGRHNNWLQTATETTFNLIAVAGDTPARPTEENGGLHNFVRFIENWNPTGGTGDAIKARISGSFVQIKRSAYATAPFNTSISTQSNNYQYPIEGNTSRTPFYLAPTRQWGYDVALLSQSPDLLAQKLATIPDDLPDEYFREVGRDDTWIANLLCAKDTKGTVATSDDTNALDESQRPANCP